MAFTEELDQSLIELLMNHTDDNPVHNDEPWGEDGFISYMTETYPHFEDINEFMEFDDYCKKQDINLIEHTLFRKDNEGYSEELEYGLYNDDEFRKATVEVFKDIAGSREMEYTIDIYNTIKDYYQDDNCYTPQNPEDMMDSYIYVRDICQEVLELRETSGFELIDELWKDYKEFLRQVKVIQKAFRKYRYDPQYKFCEKVQLRNLALEGITLSA